MDLNTIRAAITVLSFVVFVGICVWAWSSRMKPIFDRMARLPLDDDLASPPATERANEGKRDE